MKISLLELAECAKSPSLRGGIRKAGKIIADAGKKSEGVGLKMAEPLLTDTAVIHGTPKTLVSRADDISRSMARQINAIAKARQTRVDAFKNELFGDLLVTEDNPSNIIYEIRGRAKSTDSIIEKANK